MHERVLPVCIGACVFLQCVLSYILCCIDHFGNYHNNLCLSPNILHKHCFQFQIKKNFQKTKTMLMQNLRGQAKSIIILFSKIAYCVVC